MNSKEFIKKYYEASKAGKSQADLARELKWTAARLGMRANYMRGKGIHLPKLKDARLTDVESLNDYLSQLDGEDPQ